MPQGHQGVANNIRMNAHDLQALRKWDGTVATLEINDRDGVATRWAGFKSHV